MSTWNMFSLEVAKEKETIRAYGGPLSPRLPRCGDTYKAQALRELAKNQIFEQTLADLEKRQHLFWNLLDGVPPEDLAKANGMPLHEVAAILAKL